MREIAMVKQYAPKIIPIIIETDEPRLLQLPWECLYHLAYYFLAENLQFTFLRRLATQQTPQATTALAKGPLKVLLFSSLPDDTQNRRLDIETEEAEIIAGLSELVKTGLVKLTITEEGSLAALEQHLKQDFHLIFLSGHGSFDKQEDKGTFLLEKEEGGSENYLVEQLTQLLEDGIKVITYSNPQLKDPLAYLQKLIQFSLVNIVVINQKNVMKSIC